MFIFLSGTNTAAFDNTFDLVRSALISGPMGSGKTLLAAALLDRLQRQKRVKHVWSNEIGEFMQPNPNGSAAETAIILASWHITEHTPQTAQAIKRIRAFARRMDSYLIQVQYPSRANNIEPTQASVMSIEAKGMVRIGNNRIAATYKWSTFLGAFTESGYIILTNLGRYFELYDTLWIPNLAKVEALMAPELIEMIDAWIEGNNE